MEITAHFHGDEYRSPERLFLGSFFEVFLIVILISATRGLSATLAHVLNRTEQDSKHNVHKVLCVSKLCNITVVSTVLLLPLGNICFNIF